MTVPTEGAERAGSERRSKRDSKIVFSLSRGTLQLAVGTLGLSWLFAYGLGRHAKPPKEAPAVAPAVVLLQRPSEALAATGTVAVAVAAEPEPPATPPIKLFETAPDDGFGIQVGAYPARAEAEAAILALSPELEGLDVYLISVDIPGKGTWYRVRLGRFETRQAAENRRRELSGAEGSISVSYR